MILETMRVCVCVRVCVYACAKIIEYNTWTLINKPLGDCSKILSDDKNIQVDRESHVKGQNVRQNCCPISYIVATISVWATRI